MFLGHLDCLIMPIRDPDKNREYQRKWQAARYTKALKNKKCERCGSKKNLTLNRRRILKKQKRKQFPKRPLILCKSCSKKKWINRFKRISKGNDNGCRKFSELDRCVIRFMRENGYRVRQIASYFDVHHSAICDYLNGHSYKNMP